jgi:transposase-like protein
MTSTNSESQVLKFDTKGRVFTPPERRQQLLDEFERSGVSGVKFAALVGINYSTFIVWVRARRQQRRRMEPAPKPSTNPTPNVRWLEAVLDQAQGQTGEAGATLLVRLSGGTQLEISHASQIPLAAALLAALEKPALAC